MIDSNEIRTAGWHYLRHEAKSPGYIRKDDCIVEMYRGKFGEGFRIHTHLKNKGMHKVEYWIKKEVKE